MHPHHTVESKSLKLLLLLYTQRFNSLSEVKKILKTSGKLTNQKFKLNLYQPWAEKGKNVVVARKK